MWVKLEAGAVLLVALAVLWLTGFIFAFVFLFGLAALIVWLVRSARRRRVR
jgi:hypothetical protein